jgi:hypothetical protein
MIHVESHENLVKTLFSGAITSARLHGTSKGLVMGIASVEPIAAAKQRCPPVTAIPRREIMQIMVLSNRHSSFAFH